MDGLASDRVLNGTAIGSPPIFDYFSPPIQRALTVKFCNAPKPSGPRFLPCGYLNRLIHKLHLNRHHILKIMSGIDVNAFYHQIDWVTGGSPDVSEPFFTIKQEAEFLSGKGSQPCHLDVVLLRGSAWQLLPDTASYHRKFEIDFKEIAGIRNITLDFIDRPVAPKLKQGTVLVAKGTGAITSIGAAPNAPRASSGMRFIQLKSPQTYPDGTLMRDMLPQVFGIANCAQSCPGKLGIGNSHPI